MVFSGGGARGAYEIGVWQALIEEDYPIDLVVGTSVGAINATLVVQGDIECAKRLWMNLNNEIVVAVPERQRKIIERNVLRFYTRQFVQQQGADYTPLKNLFIENLDLKRFYASPIEFGIVTAELPGLRRRNLLKTYIPPEKLMDYVLASAACYPAFQPYVIDDMTYIDGGYFSIMPVELAKDMGATEYIAVDLKTMGIVDRAAKKLLQQDNCLVVRSAWDLGNFMDFNEITARRNIRLGYLDMRRMRGHFEGLYYAFAPGTFDHALASHRRHVKLLLRWMRMDLSREWKNPYRRLNAMPLLRQLKCYDDLFMGAAETCGRVFGVDPGEPYTLAEFNQALREKAAEAQAEQADQNNRPTPLRKLRRRLNSRQIALQLWQTMATARANRRFARFRPAATLMPKEFIAAIYLMLLHPVPGRLNRAPTEV